MKKAFCKMVITIFFITSLSFSAFAFGFEEEEILEWHEYVMKNPENGIVTLDDIYSLRDEYQNKNIRTNSTYPRETYVPYLEERNIRLFRNRNSPYPLYYVKDKDSMCFWCCCDGYPGDSYISGYPFLMCPFIDYGMSMRKENMEKLEEFIEYSQKLQEQIYEKAAYIKEHLKDSQYGGYYYKRSDGKVHIYLADSSKKEELEKQEIVCEEAKYSRKQIYEKMELLWETREELGICYMWVNNICNKLRVYVKNKELEKKFAEDPMLEASSIEGFLDVDLQMGTENVEELVKYLEEYGFYSEEEKYTELTVALKKLKETYPDYNFINLLYHIEKDFDYERYLDFPKELCEYVDQLPAYKKDVHFMNEVKYGDPQRLEVKRMLREYKQQYPKMSYQDIYETYIREIEENSKFSNVEKLYYYLYDKYTAAFKSNGKSAAGENIPAALFGSIMLVFGGIGVCVKKKTGI